MASEKQIEANRRNSALSTGPRTDEGKAQSRTNGMTHGLTATVVSSPDKREAGEKRYAEWLPCLKPEDSYQEFHLQLAVEASLQIENCQARERNRKRQLAKIATDSDTQWDIDRQKEASKLGKSLKRNPEEIALQLRSTPYGREWLIDRWKYLLVAVAEGQSPNWNAPESNLALDLMGKPKLFRTLILDRENPFVDSDCTRVLILREIAALEAQQGNDLRENSELRDLHACGLIFETDASLTLIRRYETAARRHFDKSITLINKAKAITSKAARPAPVVADHETSTFDASPISSSPVVSGEEVPGFEPKPILIAPPSPIRLPDSTQPGPQREKLIKIQVGNRRYRRQLEKQSRHQEYLSRQAG